MNCYLLSNGKNAILIDVGSQPSPIIDFINNASLNLRAILISHAHFDHVEGAYEIKKYFGAPFYMHAEDAKLLTRMNLFRAIFDKEKPTKIPDIDIDLAPLSQVKFDDLILEVIHTPGHTQGGVSFRYGSYLFTGDTLMKEKIGRADLPGGNRELLTSSIDKLLSLPENLKVYPGHGETFILREAQREKEKLFI